MHHDHELLSIGHCPTDGLLARQDVRVKLIVAIAAIVAVVASNRPDLPLTMFAVCLVVLLSARMSLGAFAGRLAGPIGIAAVICLLRAFMIGTSPAWSVSLGPWRLTATYEGLHDGILIASRVLGSVSVMIVLCTVTPAHGIFVALRWARLPRTWVEIAQLMYRHIFVLFEQAVSVLSAQKVRLGYASLRQSINSMGQLAGIGTLRSLDQADRTHEAMVARGYQGSLQIPALAALSKSDWTRIAMAIVVIVIAYGLSERWLP
jgi:cobalt/nickel transport system permease protein